MMERQRTAAKSGDLLWERPGTGVPRYTIGIPTYCRNEQLLEAVNSAIDQDYSAPYEILVSDNDSNNNVDWSSMQIPGHVHLRYIRQRVNLGMVGNWNALLEHGQGEYLSILCDDDRLHPSFLRRVDLALRKDPGLDLVHLPCRNFSGIWSRPQTHPVASSPDVLIRVDLTIVMLSAVNCNLAAMMRPDKVRAVGAFQESQYPSFDHLMVKRLVASGMRVGQILSPLEGGYYQLSGSTSAELETRQKFLRVDVPAYRELLSGRGLCARFLSRILEARSSIQLEALGLDPASCRQLRFDLHLPKRRAGLERSLSGVGDLIMRAERIMKGRRLAPAWEPS